MVFELNKELIQKINLIDRNIIGVIFNSYLADNDFVDAFSDNPNYNAFICYNELTSKWILKPLDQNFSEKELLYFNDCDKCHK